MQKRIAVIKDVGKILKEVYKDPKALYEVNAAILAEMYADETVPLRDLLYPDHSSIYTSKTFLERRPPMGIFRERFIEVFKKGDFPRLKEALGNAVRDFENIQLNSSSNPGPDTAKEIFSNSAGISIYFPYSENFGPNYTPAYFDNVNTDPMGSLVTIVAADRDANSGPGSQAVRRVGPNREPIIEFRDVTVNDDFCNSNPTHIVAVGAEPASILNPPPPAPPPGVNRIHIGHMRCNTHLDWLISSQGRGGGNDVVVRRLSGYLQTVNSQVTATTSEIIPIPFKRRDVRRGIYRRVFKVWDPNWMPDNNEQVMLIYEDDDNVSKTVTTSLQTILSVPGGGTVQGTITVNTTIFNVDVIMRQLKIGRQTYFSSAYIDNGYGFINDLTFLPPGSSHGWPIWEGGTSGFVSWTWPYQVIP